MASVAMVLLCVLALAISCKDEPEHIHTFSSTWSSNDEYHWHAASCEHSDQITDRSEHTWNEGEVTTPATHTANGVKTYACTVCAMTKDEVLPMDAEAHTYSEEWSKDEDKHWHASTCGHDTKRDEGNHTWDEGSVTTNPSYTAEGIKTYTCTVCSGTRTESVPKLECLPHYWQRVVEESVNATHTTTGIEVLECLQCGERRSEELPALSGAHTYADGWTFDSTYHWHASTCGHDVTSSKASHSWSAEGVVTTPATHTTDGVIVYPCVVCDAERTEVIPKAEDAHTYSDEWSVTEDKHWHASTCGHAVKSDEGDHEWNEGVVTTQATHTANGEKTYTCTVCAKTRVEVIPMAAEAHTFSGVWTTTEDKHWHASTCGHDIKSNEGNHTWDEGEITTPASHTENGEKTYTCLVCSRTKVEVIPMAAEAHTYSDEWSKDEEKHWHASTCGHDVKDSEGNHTWNEGEVTTPATHTTNGVKTFTCTVCAQTKTQSIPLLADAHTFAPDWTTNENYHWHASTCIHSVKSDYAAHSWNSGVVTKEATESEEGIMTYTCTVCSKTKTEAIPVVHYHVYPAQWKFRQVAGEVEKFKTCACGEETVEEGSYDDVFTVNNDGCLGGVEGDNYEPMVLCGDWTIPSVINEKTVEAIGYTFSSGNELGSVTFPSTVTTIGSDIFYYSTPSGTVYIPASVSEIDVYAFRSDEPFEVAIDEENPNFVLENGLIMNKDRTEVVAATFFDGSVTIPNTVITIKGSTFKDNLTITELIIPEGVETIEVCAFTGCTNLGRVTIPASLTTIEEDVFCGCTNLTSFEVSSSNPNYCSEGGALYNKDKTILIAYSGARGNVVLPSGIERIEAGAFYNCESMTSVTIPDTVTEIGRLCFYGCNGLTEAYIPDSVEQIDSYAFYGCDRLVSISVGGNAHAIESIWNSFSGVPAHITIRSGATKVTNICSFGNLITGVTIPNTVTEIESVAFRNCTNLTSIEIPASVTTIRGEAFRGCTKLESIVIPASVTTMGERAFDESVKDVVFADGMTAIPKKALYGAGRLTSVAIPGTVTEIGEFAFFNCRSLTSITFNGTVAQWNSVVKGYDWKEYVPNTAVVHCTDGDVAI